MPKHQETPRRPSSTRGALTFRVWKMLEKFRKPEVKFAIKVGLGAALLALPAFLETYRDVYTHWRGEWALLSYFVVIALSVGATTSTGLWRYNKKEIITKSRILGTSIGACAAIILYLYSGDMIDCRWWLCPANPYVLSIVGALFSTSCFYLIANTANWQPFGRFILLTYNLVRSRSVY
jgi:hypothetical protein